MEKADVEITYTRTTLYYLFPPFYLLIAGFMSISK